MRAALSGAVLVKSIRPGDGAGGKQNARVNAPPCDEKAYCGLYSWRWYAFMVVGAKPAFGCIRNLPVALDGIIRN